MYHSVGTYFDPTTNTTFNTCGYDLDVLTHAERDHRDFSKVTKLIQIFAHFNNEPVDTQSMARIYRYLSSSVRTKKKTIANDPNQCQSFMGKWNKMAVEFKLGHKYGLDGCIRAEGEYHRVCQKKHPKGKRKRLYWVTNELCVFADRPSKSIAERGTPPDSSSEDDEEYHEPTLLTKRPDKSQLQLAKKSSKAVVKVAKTVPTVPVSRQLDYRPDYESDDENEMQFEVWRGDPPPTNVVRTVRPISYYSDDSDDFNCNHNQNDNDSSSSDEEFDLSDIMSIDEDSSDEGKLVIEILWRFCRF